MTADESTICWHSRWLILSMAVGQFPKPSCKTTNLALTSLRQLYMALPEKKSVSSLFLDLGLTDSLILNEVQVVFEPGATSAIVTLHTVNDDLLEETEQFFLQLTTSSRGSVLFDSTSMATMFIKDSDSK